MRSATHNVYAERALAEHIPTSDTCLTVVLTANAAKTIALPTSARLVNFGIAGGIVDLWTRFGIAGVTVTVPSADTTDGSAPTLNPGVRRIPDGVTHVALISPAAGLVGLEFWSL